jgi:hypothetical protein
VFLRYFPPHPPFGIITSLSEYMCGATFDLF